MPYELQTKHFKVSVIFNYTTDENIAFFEREVTEPKSPPRMSLSLHEKLGIAALQFFPYLGISLM